MAFTEAQLAAALTAPAQITAFQTNAASITDVYVINNNAASARKAGWTQCAQTLTAAQAATAINASLNP